MCLVTQSCPTLCDPIDYSLPGSSVHRDSPGKNTGVSSCALLQGICPTQGSNPGLPPCRQIFTLRYQGRFKTYCKITIIKKMWYRCKERQRIQWNRIESLNNVFRHMRPFTYHKGGTAVVNSLFRKRFWVNWISIWKQNTWPLSYTDVNPRSNLQLHAKKKRNNYTSVRYSQRTFFYFGVDKVHFRRL